ncbi:MAG: ABC transporter ATP-binding protein [Clostridium sp.]|jgi:ABC-2 type transport system ATP-binding protein|nr:ABC transporter ATP-binding protein [Clostridium sp.]
MSNHVLAVDGLTKKYPDFVLDKVSFEVPQGGIVGLIGENGAGKSTTINAILGLIQKDAGVVSILGKQEQEIDHTVREQIGVVFDASNFPEALSPRKLGKVLQNIYASWDEHIYSSLLKKLSLPLDKKIRRFSKGMKMKLSIAVQLSHHSKLLILDEATSGLDPVIRDDILDMFLDFVQDEEHSILVSSHITSDLEKVADYIVFIHNGRVVFEKTKHELIYQYGIMKCGSAQFDSLDKSDIVAYRKQDYEWQVLVADRADAQKKYPKALIDPATIDEIMLLYVKGEK